jgi:transposase-like protein
VKYSKKRKEAVLKKMMAPHNRSIKELAAEEGITEATLYNWRNKARKQGLLLPDSDTGPSGWTARDKFAAVLESGSLNEQEKAEYCRRKGIYPEQLAQWQSACEVANDWDRQSAEVLKNEKKASQKRIKELEKELHRKEKALAETAALLVLRKKAEAIWGNSEEE